MTKTPQVKPDWNYGIYIGEGVVAQPKSTKWYVCQKCGNEEEGCGMIFPFESPPENCSWCGGLDFKLEVEEDD
jgi:hypothetical protein